MYVYVWDWNNEKMPKNIEQVGRLPKRVVSVNDKHYLFQLELDKMGKFWFKMN